MSQIALAGEEAIGLERVGAIGRVLLDASRGPAGVADWRRWAVLYEQWVADPDVYGGLIRQVAPGLGGSLRDVAAWAGRHARQDADALIELADFYRLVWTIDRFSKPTVALLDGHVSWSDFCLVRHGTHKVVGERFRLSFEVPGLWFADAGATWWLARLPGRLGERLVKTGATIDGADAMQLGLATHRVESAAFEAIERAYRDADPIDQVLDGLPGLVGGGTLEPVRATAGEAAGLIGEQLATEARMAHPERALGLFREALGLTLQQTLERDFAIALALAGREHRPFTSLEPGEHDSHRAQAVVELALKPPPGVPEALG